MIWKERCTPEVWRIILENAPLITTEAVITRTRSDLAGLEYLLGKRNQNPDKGLYGVIGGTVYRGEELVEALARNLFRETKIKRFRYRYRGNLSLCEEISEAGPGFHVISNIFELRVHDSPQPTEENAEYRWFDDYEDEDIARNAKNILKYVHDKDKEEWRKYEWREG